MSSHSRQHAGRSFPLGATLDRRGANFSVFAKHSRAGLAPIGAYWLSR
jgi:hypothetical protein